MTNVDDFLSHFGRKGMKWGVINDDDTSGSGASTSTKTSGSGSDGLNKAAAKFYANKTPKQLKAEGVAKKKAQKADTTGDVNDPKKLEDGGPSAKDIKQGRLSRKQKIALGVGAGIAVAGLAYYGNQHIKKKKSILDDDDDYDTDDAFYLQRNRTGVKNTDPAKIAAHKAQVDGIFGAGTGQKSEIDGEASFFAGLKTGRAIDRPGFTLPQNTVFQRLSDNAGTNGDYGRGKYSSFLSNDNKAYSSVPEFSSMRYTVNYQSDKPVKVPSTRTVLQAVKDTLADNGIKDVTDEAAISAYHDMSGGRWGEGEAGQVVSKLKKQGYSAIVDDMDAGAYGDLPMVFFGTATNVKNTVRTNKMVQDDMADVVPLDRRYV